MKRISLLFSELRKDSNAPITLRRRLFLYFLMLTLVGITAIFLLISLTGSFSYSDRQMQDLSGLELSLFTESITEHYDTVAAKGILLSEDLSKIIQDYLDENHLDLVDLNNHDDLLRELQSRCYQPLFYSLQNARCSGAYYVLDATVNTDITDTDFHNGLNLKLQNINSTQPLNTRVVLYRGSSSIARENDCNLHSRWTLEFSQNDIPFFDQMKDSYQTNLNRSYYWSRPIPVVNSWEESMYLSVPILSDDGKFLGVCGMEVSDLYYKLEYSSDSAAFSNYMHLLAPIKDNQLEIQSGLSGSMSNIEKEKTKESLTVYRRKYLNYYENTSDTYVGQHTIVQLSPITDDGYKWACAVLVPAGSYKSHSASERGKVITISLGFLFLSLLLCAWFSHKYLEPIKDSFDAIRANTTNYRKTHIEEIDDLLEFLGQKDQKESNEKTPLLVEEVLPAVDPEKFQHFMHNLSTLSPAEQRVFDLYLKEYKAKDIASELCLSMNTIKFHNANIYGKLAVSSRKELLLYMKHMQKLI